MFHFFLFSANTSQTSHRASRQTRTQCQCTTGLGRNRGLWISMLFHGACEEFLVGLKVCYESVVCAQK